MYVFKNEINSTKGAYPSQTIACHQNRMPTHKQQTPNCSSIDFQTNNKQTCAKSPPTLNDKMDDRTMQIQS